MAYEIHFQKVEIPEVDAFLDEYGAVCKKHGMQIKEECYGEGSGYLTLEPYDGSRTHLEIEEASRDVPGIARAHKEVDALREAESARLSARKAIEKEESDRREFERLKRKYGAA